MKFSAMNYNERSWSIDLIGHLKQIAARQDRPIVDVGGENTIKTEGGSLFPDVVLYGDRVSGNILQAWELKMPDTVITDSNFRRNAEEKSRLLGLDSFLLWNVSHAHLYVKRDDNFILCKAWSSLSDITTRLSVLKNRVRWQRLAEEIFSDLNDRFEKGEIEGRRFIDAYRSGGITSLIMENTGRVAEALGNASLRDANFRAGITLWWDQYQEEYSGDTREYALAQAVISNWIGKILFSHILRERDSRARCVAEINENTTPVETLELFRELSEKCNFWTVFSNSLGLDLIPSAAWNQIIQFNRLLSDLKLGSIDQAQLSAILESTVEVTVRKLRGQYPTPIELARLLVHLCVHDIIDDRILDPCCGSGTIARAAMEQKLSSGVAPDRVAQAVFAGDKDPQAIQIATLALAKPVMMNVPLRIFQMDAFTIEPSTRVDFRNPTTGKIFSESFGRFDAIVSNLPFVAQAGRKQYGNALEAIEKMLYKEGGLLTRRADVAAYLPFSLHPLLKDGGRLGVIITNAWLGTKWGDDFYRLLDHYYDLKCVITSGAGRWFKNSDVVTNVLVLEKKSVQNKTDDQISFIVLTRPLEEIRDEEAVQITAAQIMLGQTQNETMTIRTVSRCVLSRFRQFGLGGNAQFVDCEWILQLPLAPLKNFFTLQRGERRGKNKLFYPEPGHGIEGDYIKPLVKSPSNFSHLTCQPTKEAFSCSRTEQELEALGHVGALNWIKIFKTDENVKNLKKRGLMWYEMKTDTLSELVMSINYGERLFVGRITPPAFADQRLIRLVPHTAADIELAHALLNSTISLFILEGMGFGRGQGALDLNKDRIENFMHILNPDLLDPQGIDAIKTAFTPLLERSIDAVADELERPDRQHFDDTVIAAFGLKLERQRIYDALLSLVEIRQTALD